MKFILTCITVFAMFSSSLLAQTADSSESLYNSPASFDEKKTWVALELMDFGYYLIYPLSYPLTGVRGGYFLNKNLSVGGSLSHFEYEDVDYSERFSKTGLEVGATYFLGSTFYVESNLAIESFGFEDHVFSDASGKMEPLSGSTSSIGATIYVGNQWRLKGISKNLILGASWIGYQKSFVKTVDIEHTTSATNAEINGEKDYHSSFYTDGVRTIRVYLGWAF